MDGITNVLSGMRVVEVTSTVLGPYATRVMAELGADVVKVESPSGDITRWMTGGRHAGMGSLFLDINRGKRSIVMDLKRREARAAMSRLVQGADVFVQNVRPDAAAELGIDGGRLLEVDPRLVYCAAPGFGSGGPYEQKPAYDDVIQGLSGIASLQGVGKDRPEYVTTVLTDKTVALNVVYSVLAALLYRERTGKGQVIEVPMFETMVSYLLVEQMGGMTFEPPDGPPGYVRSMSPFRRPHKTKDRFISVLVYTDQHWSRFFRAIGRSELIEDERFHNARARLEHIDEAYRIVDEALATRSADAWLQELEALGIPAAPISELPDLFDDEHLDQVGLFTVETHPTEGDLRVVNPPIRFSGMHRSPMRPAPRLGEHTEEVLAESGVSRSVIRRLLRDGIVSAPGDGDSDSDGTGDRRKAAL